MADQKVSKLSLAREKESSDLRSTERNEKIPLSPIVNEREFRGAKMNADSWESGGKKSDY